MIRNSRLHWFIRLVLVVGLLFFLFWFFWILIPKLTPTRLLTNTTVSGLILENQVWSGTIRVTGDIATAWGNTITVNPGTIIIVQIQDDGFNMDFFHSHLRSGINTENVFAGVEKGEPFWDEKQKIQLHFHSLAAIGTKEQPIIIQSDSAAGSPYDFNVISIDKGVLAFVEASHYRRMEIGRNVVVRDSQFKVIGECALCVTTGNPTIINNTFEMILREAIWIDGASPRIVDNIFLNQSGEGIVFDPKRTGAPIISHNNFEMPESIAIDLIGGNERNPGVISLNTFSGGSIIRLVCDSKIKLVENSLTGLVSFSNVGCGGRYTFLPNYWGGANQELILKERILNKDTRFSIDIPTILSSPPKNVGKRS